jgi:Ala-tRNA(Pro) deacylase
VTTARRSAAIATYLEGDTNLEVIMISEKIRSFLDRNGVVYATIKHSPAFTANEIAASAHIRGREMAKIVMVKIDDWLAMVVVPASHLVSIENLRRVVGAKNVQLAHEEEFSRMFPDCEPGAMPPFGNLYGLDVYVDPDLAKDELIAFNAGSHTELIQMPYADFARLAEPKVLTTA